MCRRVDRSETGERHEAVKYKMSRSLGRITSLLAKGSTVSQASKSTRSCVCALSSQSSNRTGVIAFFTPFVVIGFSDTVGHRRLTAGQPSSGGNDVKYRNQRLGRMDLMTSRQKEGMCIAEAHPVRSFPNAKHQWK